MQFPQIDNVTPSKKSSPSNSSSAIPSKPFYLIFLRIFAGLNGMIGLLALIAFIFQLFGNFSRPSRDDGFYMLISLCLMIEGLLVFGLLNALADIAENMIEVGSYVKNLKKNKTQM